MPSHIEDRLVLRDTETRSLAPALANVIKSLGGRVKFLAETAQGRSAFAGEPASCPRNPQGLLGVDFSGPPFGSAWRTPLWWIGGTQEDGTGDWQGQRQVATVTSSSGLNLPIRFFNRMHAGGIRVPHSRCYVSIRGYKATGTNAALTIRLGYVGAREAEPAMESTATSSVATDSTVSEPTDAWWNITPGRNAIHLHLTTDHDFVLTSIMGYQRVKRTH